MLALLFDPRHVALQGHQEERGIKSLHFAALCLCVWGHTLAPPA